jgi:hypothetical protein
MVLRSVYIEGKIENFGYYYIFLNVVNLVELSIIEIYLSTSILYLKKIHRFSIKKKTE